MINQKNKRPKNTRQRGLKQEKKKTLKTRNINIHAPQIQKFFFKRSSLLRTVGSIASTITTHQESSPSFLKEIIRNVAREKKNAPTPGREKNERNATKK
jgi:hypothetical protein